MACEPFDCIKCGQRHNRCTGHVDKDEEGNPIDLRPCAKWPRKGATVCQKHGGDAKQVKAAAERRVVEGEARKMLSIEGYEPITDPFTALSEIAGEVVKLKNVLLQKVEEMESLRSWGGESGEQIDVVFAAYERAIDRCTHILSGMARLDLEDRIARLHSRINDEAAKTIIAALLGALDAAEIQGPTRDVIVSDFGHRLQPSQHVSSRSAITA